MKALFGKTSETKPSFRTSQNRTVTPEVNIYENRDGYLLEAEMPGVGKDGLELTLEGNQLTITGKPGDEIVPGDVLLRERAGVDYRREFELDPVIDTNRISARMNQGVLYLTLPKSDAVKPRKIVVGE